MTTEERIAKLEKELAELKESIKEEDENNQFCWKPKHGERYCYINSEGHIKSTIWYDDYSGDFHSYEIGNCFANCEDANFALEKLKVIHELKQFAEPKERAWDIDNTHFCIGWDFTLDRIDIIHNYVLKRSAIYFESVDMAENAIKAVGEDRIKKYYLEVEE